MASVFLARSSSRFFFGEVLGENFSDYFIFIFEVWFREVISDGSLVRNPPYN